MGGIILVDSSAWPEVLEILGKTDLDPDKTAAITKDRVFTKSIGDMIDFVDIFGEDLPISHKDKEFNEMHVKNVMDAFTRKVKGKEIFFCRLCATYKSLDKVKKDSYKTATGRGVCRTCHNSDTYNREIEKLKVEAPYNLSKCLDCNKVMKAFRKGKKTRDNCYWCSSKNLDDYIQGDCHEE